MLDAMQKDVLTELVNIYVGEAAKILSEMTNQAVDLKVPEVIIISAGDEKSEFFPVEDVLSPGHIISASIRFSQGLQGKAFLIFPAKQAKVLVNACMGETVPKDWKTMPMEMLDTDFDVLNEVANIILNSIMGGFGNLLDAYLDYSIPEVELIYVKETEQKLLLEKQTNILVLRTFFTLSDIAVHGAMLITLSLDSITHLINKINRIIEGIDSDAE